MKIILQPFHLFESYNPTEPKDIEKIFIVRLIFCFFCNIKIIFCVTIFFSLSLIKLLHLYVEFSLQKLYFIKISTYFVYIYIVGALPTPFLYNFNISTCCNFSNKLIAPCRLYLHKFITCVLVIIGCE